MGGEEEPQGKRERDISGCGNTGHDRLKVEEKLTFDGRRRSMLS